MKVAGITKWPRRRLGDFFRLKHGYAFKGAFFAESGPYIVLTPGNFFDEGGFKHKDKEKYYTGEIPDGFILNRGDLLVAMTEQKYGLLGSAAIVPESDLYLHNQRLGLVTNLRVEEFEKGYLFYLFNSHGVRAQIQATANGAKVRHTSPSRIYEVEVYIPPIEVQRKITSILFTYDDLLENNTRRIKILEEMVQRIYREWFINFRFPGHEKVKMVKSLLGKIPEGWEVGIINDVVTIESGFAFKSETFVEDGFYGLVTIKNVQEGQFITTCQSRLDDIPEKMSNYCYLSTGDILLSLTGNIGRVCLVYGANYLLNQRVAKLSPNSDSNRAFVYFTFRNNDLQKRLEMISTGVAQQNLSPVLMGKLEFVIPHRSILADYSKICEPIVDEILLLSRKTQNLRQTRDLLLPKLISGEIDVSELDIETGEGKNNAA